MAARELVLNWKWRKLEETRRLGLLIVRGLRNPSLMICMTIMPRRGRVVLLIHLARGRNKMKPLRYADSDSDSDKFEQEQEDARSNKSEETGEIVQEAMIAMEAMKVKTLVNSNGRFKVIIDVRFISIAKIKISSNTMQKRQN